MAKLADNHGKETSLKGKTLGEKSTSERAWKAASPFRAVMDMVRSAKGKGGD